MLSAPDEKPSPTNIVSEAQASLRRLDRINNELNEIFRKKTDGYRGGIGLTGPEKKREKELYEDRSACLTQTKKVAEMLKVGTSVFSYPGLVALSKIDFDVKRNVYTIRLVIDYRRYEDGEERHPTYRLIEFSNEGLITALKDFATVRMVTS